MVYYKNTSLQVATGSGTSVHKLVEHGNTVLAAAGDNRIIEVSCSSEFGDRALGGGTGNTLTNGVIANGVFRIPLYDSAEEEDVSILNTIAGTPSSYNGYMFYMTSEQGVSEGNTVGSTTVSVQAGQYFGRGAVMYFCRNGKWFHDGLVTVPKVFIQRILTSFTGSTSWHVSTASDNFFNRAAALVSAPMTNEFSTGWNTTNPSEPSWTYGTHLRINTNFTGSGVNTWHVSTASDDFFNRAASLISAPAAYEYNTGWGTADPSEPSWTYGTHLKINTNFTGSGVNTWHVSTASDDFFNRAASLVSAPATYENGTGWGTADPNEPSWTYGTHLRINTNFTGSGVNTWHVSTGSDDFFNRAASLVSAPYTHEPGTGWGTADPNEPTWTYGTHLRINTNFTGSGVNTWHVSTGSDNFSNYASALVTSQTFASGSWLTGETNHYTK